MTKQSARAGRLRPALILLAAVFAAGLAMRLAPLFQGPDAIAQRFITEDGYLMLTVARNMAIGKGMSVSDGEIGTNGIQPLATFVYTVPYVMVGGDRIGGLVGVTIIMAGIAVAGAFAVRRLASAMLSDDALSPPRNNAEIWAIFVAALWFISLTPVKHTTNALETGLYALLVTVTAIWFGRISGDDKPYGLRDQVIFGSLCGLTFLGRIDGAMFVAALFGVRFVSVLVERRLTLRQAILEALPPGLISLAFAAPWLLHNQIRFGSIMPISGPAQSLNASFAQNLPFVPAKLFEHMFPMLPVPGRFEAAPLAGIAFAIIVVAVAAVLVRNLWERRHPMRYVAYGYAVFGICLVGYYGLFFGAPHFLSRYLFPLSPFLLIAAVHVALDLARNLGRARGLESAGRFAIPLAAGGALALSLALAVNAFVLGPPRHQHFQVVDWVAAHVPDETWVGAIQTGTLGYWHDRTINLDGKVNPEALRARIEKGNVLDYVVDSRIDVLADWSAIAAWPPTPSPRFSEAFEPVVADNRLNLGVQVRRGVALIDAPPAGRR